MVPLLVTRWRPSMVPVTRDRLRTNYAVVHFLRVHVPEIVLDNDFNCICTHRICGRTGKSVGTTRNPTESGTSRVRSRAAAGAKYGEFLSRKKFHGFSPEKLLKGFQKLIMPTVERPSISLSFNQYSFLANTCKINLAYYVSFFIYFIIVCRSIYTKYFFS